MKHRPKNGTLSLFANGEDLDAEADGPDEEADGVEGIQVRLRVGGAAVDGEDLCFF